MKAQPSPEWKAQRYLGGVLESDQSGSIEAPAKPVMRRLILSSDEEDVSGGAGTARVAGRLGSNSTAQQQKESHCLQSWKVLAAAHEGTGATTGKISEENSASVQRGVDSSGVVMTSQSPQLDEEEHHLEGPFRSSKRQRFNKEGKIAKKQLTVCPYMEHAGGHYGSAAKQAACPCSSEHQPSDRRLSLRDRRTPKKGNAHERMAAHQQRFWESQVGSMPPSEGDFNEMLADNSQSLGTEHMSNGDTNEKSSSKLDGFIDDSQSDGPDYRKELASLGYVWLGDTDQTFLEYLDYQARCLLDPSHPQEVDDKARTEKVCLTIERSLADKRDKCVESQAWKGAAKSFIPALVSRPHAMLHALDSEEHYGCAACNRPKAHANSRITFSGPAYEPDWLDDRKLMETPTQGSGRAVWLDDYHGRDSDSDENVVRDANNEGALHTDGSKTFVIGKHCAARVRLYHNLLHFKHNLLDQLKHRLQMEMDAIAQRASTSDEQATDTAVASIIDDREFTGELLRQYMSLHEMAIDYLNRGDSRFGTHEAGKLSKQIHLVLDTMPATAATITHLEGAAKRTVRLEANGRRLAEPTPKRIASAALRSAHLNSSQGVRSLPRDPDQMTILQLMQWKARPKMPEKAARQTQARQAPMKQATLSLLLQGDIHSNAAGRSERGGGAASSMSASAGRAMDKETPDTGPCGFGNAATAATTPFREDAGVSGMNVGHDNNPSQTLHKAAEGDIMRLQFGLVHNLYLYTQADPGSQQLAEAKARCNTIMKTLSSKL